MERSATADGQGRPWRGLTPEQRRDERRRRLLDAALDAFGTAGYQATSLTGVCAAAGVGHRHFYELFDGREQLFSAVYEEQIAGLFSSLVAALDGLPLEVAPRVEAALAASLHAQLGDPRVGRVIQLEILGVSAELEARRRQVIHAFRDVTVEQYRVLAAAGVVRPRAFGPLAHALVGAANELIIEGIAGEADEASLLAALTELYVTVFES